MSEKALVIVESPAKARTIGKYLGSDYLVTSSVGHIRDLPRSAKDVPEKYKGTAQGRLGIDVDNNFEPIYIVPKDKKKVVTELRKLLKQSNMVYLATDEDREGEAIAWHILEILKPKVPVKRMVFHEITKTAIAEAINNARDINLDLVHAQETRRILDRLVGYEISPVLWKKVMPKLSAGRVQSVATRLIVERERQRIAFNPSDYASLEAELKAKSETFTAKLNSIDQKRLAIGKDFEPDSGKLKKSLEAKVVVLDLKQVEELAKQIKGKAAEVQDVTKKPWTQKPYAPFTTSTLQQEAGTKLKFSAARTMAVAQRLYERGHITYMRTDSVNLSNEAVDACRKRIKSQYGTDLLPEAPRSYSNKSKNAQEAHEAIRPSGSEMPLPSKLDGLDMDEAKLYDLIWKRTLASQMINANGDSLNVKLSLTNTDGKELLFSATGRTVIQPGFFLAYVEGSEDSEADIADKEKILPPLSVGNECDVKDANPSTHTTTPPARFTEASLVKELEGKGIGRPSTYASIIQTIQDRGYVFKKGSALVPTWTAFAKVRLLEEHFSNLVDYEFTAKMEEDLDAIASGDVNMVTWLAGFYFEGENSLKTLVGDDRIGAIDARELNSIPLGKKGKEDVVLRVGRYGPYIECGEERAQIPDGLAPDECTLESALVWLEDSTEDGKVLGVDEATGKNIYARTGRFGPFVQLGETPEKGDKKAEKPKYASLFATMTIERVTLEEAKQLLTLPREVGTTEDGRTVTAANGRFGPYLQSIDSEGKKDNRSLDNEEKLLTITLAESEEILAQPKRRKAATKKTLAELGEDPNTKLNIVIMQGRYGPYVTDTKTNCSVPKGRTPEDITLEEAASMLAQKRDS
mgnify:CR=1 FL=1|jgi:DNA topoisomerase-1